MLVDQGAHLEWDLREWMRNWTRATVRMMNGGGWGEEWEKEGSSYAQSMEEAKTKRDKI